MRQIIKMLMKGSSSISIDGRDFVGRSITINGDKVVIDGVEQAGSLTGPVSITLHGDADRDARIAELERGELAFNAVMDYMLSFKAEYEMDFLRCWHGGNFQALRKEWPEVSKAVYFADPLAAHEAIAEELAKEQL